MDSANPLRRLARHTPAQLDGIAEYGADALSDLAHEEITTEMQDALSELSEERTLPVVG